MYLKHEILQSDSSQLISLKCYASKKKKILIRSAIDVIRDDPDDKTSSINEELKCGSGSNR